MSDASNKQASEGTLRDSGGNVDEDSPKHEHSKRLHLSKGALDRPAAIHGMNRAHDGGRSAVSTGADEGTTEPGWPATLGEVLPAYMTPGTLATLLNISVTMPTRP